MAVRGDLTPFLRDIRTAEASADTLGAKLTKALSPRALTSNTFGKGPEELVRSLDRATDSAGEAFAAVQKLDRTNLDTAKARKYADVLDEIGIEAQQTVADLRNLQAADPRFNTPQLQAAADQLDRVGREAAESARSLNDIKGVGADTEFERMAHQAREAGTALDNAGGKTDGLLGKLNGVKGVLAGLGLALGAQQLLSFAGDASQAFSDLEQSGRSVEAIFGDSAGTIQAWGERAADAAGLSKREVNQSAAVMGQALQNMGYDAQTAADMVVTLQQRAADLAMQFGGDTADAVLAIGSLLRGERDTIEKYGVSIKQADVEARILALGLDTSTDAARKNAEAIASLDLFMQQSTSSAGRFGEEVDSLAGRLEQNQAKIENGMAAIGEQVANVQLGFFNLAEEIARNNPFVNAARDIDNFALDFGERGAEIHRLAEDMGTDFQTMKDRIKVEMAESGASFEETVAKMELDALNASTNIPDRMSEAMRGMSDEIRLGGPVVAEEAGKVAGLLPYEIKARDAEIRAAGRENIVQLAVGMLEAQNSPKTAIEAMNRVVAESMSPMEQIAFYTGEETMNQLALALNSQLSIDRVSGMAALSEIIAQLNTLGPAGVAAGKALMDGLGFGIDTNHGTPTDAARRAAGVIRGVFPFSEPKDPLSPFRGISKWGANIVRAISGGILGDLGTAAAAAGALAGALVPSLGGPSLTGAMSGSLPARSAPGMAALNGAGGNTYHVHLEDRLVVRSVEDIGYGLKRLSDLGKLPGSKK